MNERKLGRSNLAASLIGLGAGEIGDLAVSDEDAERVMQTAIDHGVRVFDTARSYGASEDRIGRFFLSHSHLRDRVTIVTKGGYGIHNAEDWSSEAITRGIDEARAKLRTESLDVFLLHSCPQREDLVEVLVRARDAGRVRAIGYSGDNEGLAWAARVDAFDVVECSVSLVDRHALASSIPAANAGKKGVIAKRALANAAWAKDHDPYTSRLRAMFDHIDAREDGVAWDELAIRFAAHAEGVSCTLVGTRDPNRIARAIDLANKGPLDADLTGDLRERYERVGRDWPGVI
jgi:aryl-alcohol dehydrogenase-like predicted oxidoreductase